MAPSQATTSGGGGEGEGGNRIASPGRTPSGHQHERQRVGAAGDADREARAGEVAQRRLQRIDLAARIKPQWSMTRETASSSAAPSRAALRRQIDEGDGGRHG